MVFSSRNTIEIFFPSHLLKYFTNFIIKNINYKEIIFLYLVFIE